MPRSLRFTILFLIVHAVSLGLARAVEGVPEGLDPMASNDPQVFCPLMKSRSQKLGGERVTVYELSSAKLMACVPDLPASPWNVTRSRWSQADETEWQLFLTTMGESKCNTLEKCLKNPQSNILWTEWDRTAAHYADCADFPYYLRAYFSFKRGLPMSFVSGFRAKELTPEIQSRLDQSRAAFERKFAENPAELAEKLAAFDEQARDPRYTWNGNNPVKRYTIPDVQGGARSFFTSVRYIRDTVSTGTYRMFETEGNLRPDFYSPLIDPKGIRPGTVLYRPAGHAAIVFKVDGEGAIHFLDAHPDNSVTRGTFNREYARGNPNLGGGFKNWRPFLLMEQIQNQRGETKWTEARGDANGVIRAASFRFLSDAEISRCALKDGFTLCDYSDEQYRGNQPSADGNWKTGKFVIGGREVDYFDYVRFQLSGGRPIDPVAGFRDEMTALCKDVQGRVETVDTALRAGLDQKAHPAEYPRNIYGAEGEWEEYSSPGRDIRIRGRIEGLVKLARHFLTVVASQDPTYDFWPANKMRSESDQRAKLVALKRAFLDIYGQVAHGCEVRYQNSAGEERRLPFEVVLARLSKMSFDPYLCVERRWGATARMELKSCADGAEKTAWYTGTQFLRNMTERDTSMVMGFHLSELRRMEDQKTIDNRVDEESFNLLRQLEGL